MSRTAPAPRFGDFRRCPVCGARYHARTGEYTIEIRKLPVASAGEGG